MKFLFKVKGGLFVIEVIGITIFVLVFVLVISLIYFMISWATHIDMNKMHEMPYDWVSFKTFMEEFKKYESHPDLDIDNRFKGSIFLYDGWRHVVYLHASIVEFNGSCMIFYPLSYLRYCLWKHRLVSRRRKGMRK